MQSNSCVRVAFLRQLAQLRICPKDGLRIHSALLIVIYVACIVKVIRICKNSILRNTRSSADFLCFLKHVLAAVKIFLIGIAVPHLPCQRIVKLLLRRIVFLHLLTFAAVPRACFINEASVGINVCTGEEILHAVPEACLIVIERADRLCFCLLNRRTKLFRHIAHFIFLLLHIAEIKCSHNLILPFPASNFLCSCAPVRRCHRTKH